MRLRRFPEVIEGLSFLDPPSEAIGRFVSKAVPPGRLKDLLSGTWLGHALHPMLTDVPIGFWTSAWTLDMVGGKKSGAAARKLVGLGILAAVPTAATGASDWADTTGGERRVGLVHAAANSAALAAFVASYLHRRKGNRAKGIGWGSVGALSATVGGHLGGHLIDALGVGVDNTAFEVGPLDWLDVGSAADAAEGRPHVVDAAGVPVLIVREGSRLLALANRCTHRGGPLHEGPVRAGCVTCPWHGSIFRLEDGEVERGPAALPQPKYQAREREGRIEIRRLALAAL
ncbi:MAG: Ferredoxin, 2Fe-2S [uncultured Acidimicrobiales bacterium]|uniref:Ferredoxin, 2Fe-2S n=1 Tax=uncultured Acidimicrobiales bacterium TaxID=310071 RepID=A0A6J4J534_9ACTN|nr:MAG: Ferredoxin, 2Fe-2S [uncultured Acidimicrobiales bacterium]